MQPSVRSFTPQVHVAKDSSAPLTHCPVLGEHPFQVCMRMAVLYSAITGVLSHLLLNAPVDRNLR